LALTSQEHRDRYEPGKPATGNSSGKLVNWISSQSVPEMLPPRACGSTRSELLTLLENGHYAVQLSHEEFEKIACWIDLLVPFCGDYTEANAWSAAERARYQHFLDKRKRMEHTENASLAQWRDKESTP
jgi:hypothetical protein